MPNPPPPTINWKDFWDIAAHIGQVVGLMAAGLWGYFNFVKSRTYFPRMELSVSGKIYLKGTQNLLIPRINLRNIGMSKVQLLQRGSGYRIWYATGTTKVGGNLKWFGGTPVFRFFEEHEWIEPGESIFDEHELHALPANSVAAKIEVRLRAPVGVIYPRVTVFNCSAVVSPDSEKEEHNA
jgi:hypothetical protein